MKLCKIEVQNNEQVHGVLLQAVFVDGGYKRVVRYTIEYERPEREIASAFRHIADLIDQVDERQKTSEEEV